MTVVPSVTAAPPGEGFLRCRVALRRTGEKAVLADSGELSVLQTLIRWLISIAPAASSPEAITRLRCLHSTSSPSLNTDSFRPGRDLPGRVRVLFQPRKFRS